MTYISSGQLRADIEKATGESLTRQEAEEPEELDEDGDEDESEDDDDDDEDADSLERFPKKLRTELVALRDLSTEWSLPKLCALTWGDFCSVPELTGEDYDEVLEDWFDGDKAATKFVMSAVDIINGGGGFYVVVNTDGRMGLVCEDPYSFDPLECTLQDFLQALVAAHQAACTKGLEAARAELSKVVDERTAKMLLTFAERLAPKKEKTKK